jgi:Hereditary spastic paraplegia protein strumpellin
MELQFPSFLTFVRFLEELEEGVYIQQTIESVLQNEDGKQMAVRNFDFVWVFL